MAEQELLMLFKKELSESTKRVAGLLALMSLNWVFGISLYFRIFSSAAFVVYAAGLILGVEVTCLNVIELWYVHWARRKFSKEPISSAGVLSDYYDRSYRLGRFGMLSCAFILTAVIGIWVFGAVSGYWIWEQAPFLVFSVFFAVICGLIGVALFFGGREKKTKKANLKRLVDQIRKEQSPLQPLG